MVRTRGAVSVVPQHHFGTGRVCRVEVELADSQTRGLVVDPVGGHIPNVEQAGGGKVRMQHKAEHAALAAAVHVGHGHERGQRHRGLARVAGVELAVLRAHKHLAAGQEAEASNVREVVGRRVLGLTQEAGRQGIRVQVHVVQSSESRNHQQHCSHCPFSHG